MTQPTLRDVLLYDEAKERKRGHVPASSVSAYQSRPRDQRIQDAVEIVRLFPDCTSAELAQWHFSRRDVTTDDKLYLRRGLADAKKLGLVAHAGKRDCSVAGTLAMTWRLKQR